MIPYLQGYYTPRNPQKYKGTLPCIYRSRPELRLMRFFDTNPRILEWTSESIIIPYIKPTDNKMHRYFVDFSCVLQEANGNKIRYLIEYKPYKHTIMPEKGHKSEKTFLLEQVNYSVNQAKWRSAKEYAASHKMKFQILTEKDLPE